MGGLQPWHSYRAHINLVSSQEGEEAPLNTSLALFLLSSLLQVSLGSGDHLQDNGLLWLHEAFRVQDQWDLEQEEKTTKQPRQLGERTDRTTGALQLTHIPATTCFQCISQLRCTYSRSITIAPAATSWCLTALSSWINWLVSSGFHVAWYKELGALINRLHVEGRAAKSHSGSCS